MASLKDLKGRINSVKSTQKITKAMKMVAAAKLRRATERAEAGRPYAQRLSDVMSDTHETLRHWMMGKVIAMIIVGLLTWGGLLALGIPLAGTLALLAAILTFIPNFGPVVSAAPPVLLALAENPQKALWVVLLFVGIQIVESYFITPFIQKKAIEMPPAVILISQVILSILFGFLGLLVAMPLTAALVVVVRELYVEDVLEHDPDGPSSDDVVDSPEDGDGKHPADDDAG